MKILAALAALSACKTTETSSATAAVKGAEASGLGTTLPLARDEAQSLYLKMLEAELAAGIKVPKDQLHTSRALIACQKSGDAPACVFQSRLAASDLAATQPLNATLGGKIWGFMQVARPDLAATPLLLADVTCDYIGKQSPPFTVEDVTCFVALPRAPGEAVFADQVAEDLGEALRGDAAYGNAKITLSGAVSCQWLPGSPRTPCVVRSAQAGVLSEKVTELSAGTSAQVAKALLQTWSDALNLAHKPVNILPSTQAGSATCLIDNTTMETDGRRTYVCRASTEAAAGA